MGGSQPSCNACLQNTMSVFESATADRGSALAGTYASAASQVNVMCGPGFVNQSLAAAVTTSRGHSMSSMTGSGMGLVILLALCLSWLL